VKVQTARIVARGVLLLTVASSARADEDEPRREPLGADEPFETKAGYGQVFATVMAGTGLRFNNPFRLPTALGENAESLSRSSAYLDLGLAVTLGSPLTFQHGLSLRTSIGMEGIGQSVFTPSYFVWRRRRALAAFGRAGVPIVLSPDTTGGLEAALGGAFFLTGGIGLVGELVGSFYYGAGSPASSTSTYPMMSGQLGLIGTYEVLP
jgi:hypothetical protein